MTDQHVAELIESQNDYFKYHTPDLGFLLPWFGKYRHEYVPALLVGLERAASEYKFWPLSCGDAIEEYVGLKPATSQTLASPESIILHKEYVQLKTYLSETYNVMYVLDRVRQEPKLMGLPLETDKERKERLENTAYGIFGYVMRMMGLKTDKMNRIQLVSFQFNGPLIRVYHRIPDAGIA